MCQIGNWESKLCQHRQYLSKKEKYMNLKIEQLLSDDMQGEQGDFIPLISDGDSKFEFDEKDGELLPILALRNMVMFPNVVMPVSVARSKSLRLIREVYAKNGYLGVSAQRDMKVDDPKQSDLNAVGVIAQMCVSLKCLMEAQL